MRKKNNSVKWGLKSQKGGTNQVVNIGVREHIDLVVDDVVRRRQAGEFVADEMVIKLHPELMPELADELRAAEEIHRAFLAAQKAGAITEPRKNIEPNEVEENEAFDFGGAICVRISGYTITDEVYHGGQATVWFKEIALVK